MHPRSTSWSTFGAPSLPRHGCRRYHRRHPRPTPSPPLEPAIPPATMLPPLAMHRRRRTSPKKKPSSTVGTHHCPATIDAIRAIHHDGDDEHIPNPSRPQADVDHSGHTRQIFLTRHQQIHLHPAPIVTHFKSELYHHSIWIFRGHGSRFDPIVGDHKYDAKHFLLKPHLTVKFKRMHLSSFFRHQQAPHQQICTVHHVHKIKSVSKLSGPHPTDDGDRLACIAHDACPTLSCERRLDKRYHARCCSSSMTPPPLPDYAATHAATTASSSCRHHHLVQLPDTVSLARTLLHACTAVARCDTLHRSAREAAVRNTSSTLAAPSTTAVLH
ncbi:hypothetical protein ACLOJK_022707 [Asimina triloba]